MGNVKTLKLRFMISILIALVFKGPESKSCFSVGKNVRVRKNLLDI